jgi:tripartite-type tricarboxylate transporter receptor subunit TctC
MRRRELFGTAAAGLFAPSILRAEAAWPERPLRLIVPFPPGGSNDTIARLMQPKLQDLLGKPVLVENRGGASGSVGAIEMARTAPDGYSWILVQETESTNQTTMRLPYRLMQAFAPVSLLATGPFAFIAHHSTPWRTFADLVAAAKEAPDSIAYATLGIGSLPHVSTTLLQQLGDFKLTHVPYRGGAPAVQAVIAGEVPLIMSNIVVTSQHIKAGTLRPLAVTSPGETRHLPGVKSFAQQGYADFEANTWWALLGRAGTPEPILRRMSEVVMQTMQTPDVRDRLEGMGADVIAGGPERCRRFINSEVEKWGRVIRDNNITAES